MFKSLSFFFLFLSVLFVGWGLSLSVLQGADGRVAATFQQLCKLCGVCILFHHSQIPHYGYRESATSTLQLP